MRLKFLTGLVYFTEILWLPKNKGLDGVVETLENVGANKRIRVRAEDIPELVYRFGGVGLTGSDLYLDYALEALETGSREKLLDVVDKLTWREDGYKFGKPALCLMYAAKNENVASQMIVNKKYKVLARKLLQEKVGIVLEDFKDVLLVSGSSEDICKVTEDVGSSKVVDIVSSGKTAEKAKLDTLVPLYYVDPILIGKSGTYRSDNVMRLLRREVAVYLLRNPQPAWKNPALSR